ncbi:hypothetical protein [Subtercola endophyticus]|uniref:hypothetical protein n=1 Tax=Subtercola endophyticus TaxID=2895559 RepID=UPI001E6287D5|nr:hypothetical protein [Subtercola endophyticus]UFS59647.1 hypothetical protein LQ955_02270 [Subtercola endophyticus]
MAEDSPTSSPHLPVRRVGRRRVQTDPVDGTDARPQSSATLSPELAVVKAREDSDDARDAPPSGAGPNDARLRADKPPHWG